jgi:hypothetical protein
MKQSDSIAKLAAALVAAQSEVENATKNAQNPHFRSSYADLAEIINTTRPVLTKHGLAVVQSPGFEAGVATLETLLMHTSGEWIAGISGSPVSKQDPQGVGSAITYLRRYSLAALCAIAQEDDDGDAASRKPALAGAPDALVMEVQTLWLKAASLGLDAAKTDGMTACETAIHERDADKLSKARAWLKKHIKEAEAQ